MKTHENVFASKTLSKVETFENATKEMQYKCWKHKRWNGNLSGVVYYKSSCGFGKAMVKKNLVLFVLLLLCCFNTATASESGDYGGL